MITKKKNCVFIFKYTVILFLYKIRYIIYTIYLYEYLSYFILKYLKMLFLIIVI